jgi:hypothetical protein
MMLAKEKNKKEVEENTIDSCIKNKYIKVNA